MEHQIGKKVDILLLMILVGCGNGKTDFSDHSVPF